MHSSSSLANDTLPYIETFHDTSFYEEVIDGLSTQPRSIPPKFFYDKKGSQLFDAICKTPEYYPTRTEKALLERYLDDISQYITPESILVEPGCGSCEKVMPLLKHTPPYTYVPMDISGDYLQGVAQRLAKRFPAVRIHPACIDYTSPLTLPFKNSDKRCIAFFPGSSIGNFEPDDAVTFLQNIAHMVGKNGGLLIGVDLKKNKAILNKAYNDNAGVTAEFNKNLLTRINNELNGQVEVNNFKHHAFYNQEKGRIEMHLISTTDQIVTIDKNVFKFKKDESIHTENSYKYTIEEFHLLARQAGYQPLEHWIDDQGLFSIHYLARAT